MKDTILKTGGDTEAQQKHVETGVTGNINQRGSTIEEFGPRFNLTDIYSGIDDPQIDKDVARLADMYVKFSEKYRGNLAQTPSVEEPTVLGNSIDDYVAIENLEGKLKVYLYLQRACNQRDEDISSRVAKINEDISALRPKNLTFYDIEIGAIPEDVFLRLIDSDQRVAFHRPYLEDIRLKAKYLLSEEVETALAVREAYGPLQWHKFVLKQLAAIQVQFDGEDLSLAKLSSIITDDLSSERRARAMSAMNKAVKEKVADVYVEGFNNRIGEKNIDDSERGYTTPMQRRNIDNKVSADVVDALHDAVRIKGAELAKRYYNLVAKCLGVEKLTWSDRNARLGESSTVIPWDQGVEIVREAYVSFSPTLAARFEEMLSNGRIDAPSYPGKQNGAFNFSASFPHGPESFVLLNYLGTVGDVSTLAHEIGHAVHGLEAGKVQGPLMMGAPIALCETASVFSEMVTFQSLLDKIESPQERFVLLMDKIKGFMNTVVRQIQFSEFEQRLHEARKNGPLTTEQFISFWKETIEEFYGKNGETFDYKGFEDMDYHWAAVQHFFKPFYVYGYAFGELLTQSLFAVKEDFGERFEPLYLDLLRAGGTKDASQLLHSFGLDPSDQTFWIGGMTGSVEKWLNAAEALLPSLEAKIPQMT